MNDFHNLVIKIGEELGIKVTFLSDAWTILLEKDNKMRYITGFKFDLNMHALGNVIDDKGLFYDLLIHRNIPVIEQYVIFHDYNKNKVIDYFNEHNQKIVVKGSIGHSGHEVFLVNNLDTLFKTVDKLLISQYSLSLCPYYHIKSEYRVIVLDNTCRLIFGKIKPTVIGNGENTVKELAISNYEYYLDHENELLNPDYIPKENEEVEINFKFNLVSGGKTFTNIDLDLKNKVCDLALQVTKETGITFASVDIIHTIDNQLLVMEANSGVKMYNFINQNKDGYDTAYNIYRDAIELMFK